MSCSIFFDLETTDTSPIGQILNYCFIAVDKNFKEIGRLHENIRISRLQLPQPHAIFANKVNVLKHQIETELTENEACQNIINFFQEYVSKFGKYKISLCGYNINNFDIRFLRTTLARNGFNPYFPVNVKDLYPLVKLFATHDPRIFEAQKSKGFNKLSLSLENVTSHFKILSGAQTHESSDDVLLTINLAELLARDFSLDVRSTSPYEAFEYHSKKPGVMVRKIERNYDLASNEAFFHVPHCLLDSDDRYSLWVDLEEFESGDDPTKAIRFFKNHAKDFAVSDNQVFSDAEKKLGRAAMDTLSNVNLANYFNESTCDIEADIYRLDKDSMLELAQCIHGEKSAKPRTRDQKILLTRYKLATAAEDTPGLNEQLKAYAKHRYGGKMLLDRFTRDDKIESTCHPSLKSMLETIKELSVNASTEDLALMEALNDFYMNSEILNAAPELLNPD